MFIFVNVSFSKKSQRSQRVKKQTSRCCSISFNPYGISNLEIWNHGKKKRKAILLLAYIADVSCLTNHLFYM